MDKIIKSLCVFRAQIITYKRNFDKMDVFSKSKSFY